MLALLRRSAKGLTETAVPELKRRIALSASVLANENLSSNTNNTDVSTKKVLQTSRRHPRGLSTHNHPVVVPAAATGTVTSKEESREFMAVFPDVVRDLTEAGRHQDVPDATKWFSKVLQYNVPGGKKNRGLALVFAYKMLVKPEDLTPENIRLAQILGWCIEMFQAFFLIMDDVMDGSETRRGRPCWYRKNNLGVAAINDGILLESGIYQLLRTHFRDKPYYVDIMELFHDVALKTSMGQSLDLLSCQFGRKPDLEKFTMNRYNTIVKYKTAYYSFQLPVALAMHMAGIQDTEMHRQAKTILLEMGQFFQVQDDYLDCFGDPEVTGKVGTDIEDGKCTWLSVVALQRCTPDQRKTMETCYGSKNPTDVAQVKQLYEDLGLPHTYATYEESSYKIISTHIQQVSRGLPHNLFFKFMEKIYRPSNKELKIKV